MKSKYNDVVAVPLPDQTATYVPLPNKEMIQLVKDQIEIFIPGSSIVNEEYWLSSDHQRMCARFDLLGDGIEDNFPMSVMIKNSYDKSSAAAIGTGVLCEDKFCTRSEDITLIRKHTKFLKPSFSAYVAKCLDTAFLRYKDVLFLTDILKKVECTDLHAFSLLGMARGFGTIGTRAMSDAYKRWNQSSESQTLWTVSKSILGYVEDRGEPSDMLEDAGKLGNLIEMLPEIFNIQIQGELNEEVM